MLTLIPSGENAVLSTCVSLSKTWVSTIVSPTHPPEVKNHWLTWNRPLLGTSPPLFHSHLQGTWGWRTCLSGHWCLPLTHSLQRKKKSEGHHRGHSSGLGHSAPQTSCPWVGSAQERLASQQETKREMSCMCSSTRLCLLSWRASWEAGLEHVWRVEAGLWCRPGEYSGKMCYVEAGGQCFAPGRVSSWSLGVPRLAQVRWYWVEAADSGKPVDLVSGCSSWEIGWDSVWVSLVGSDKPGWRSEQISCLVPGCCLWSPGPNFSWWDAPRARWISGHHSRSVS